jgi:hypothetical protein
MRIDVRESVAAGEQAPKPRRASRRLMVVMAAAGLVAVVAVVARRVLASPAAPSADFRTDDAATSGPELSPEADPLQHVR